MRMWRTCRSPWPAATGEPGSPVRRPRAVRPCWLAHRDGDDAAVRRAQVRGAEEHQLVVGRDGRLDRVEHVAELAGQVDLHPYPLLGRGAVAVERDDLADDRLGAGQQGAGDEV